MAGGAIAIARIGQIVVGRGTLHSGAEFRSEVAEASFAVMAFQAHGEHGGTAQQPRIHRPVRLMAGFAAFDAHRAVLIDERSALVGVAVETGFFVALFLIDHAWPGRHLPRGRERAMRIMAVRALDDAFIHPMFKRHGELRANGAVAGVAQLGLGLGEQKFRRGGFVNRMAVGAYHVLLRVCAAADVRSRNGLAVAAQAGVQGFVGGQFGESDNGRFPSASLDVGLAWSVAAFAAACFQAIPFRKRRI